MADHLIHGHILTSHALPVQARADKSSLVNTGELEQPSKARWYQQQPIVTGEQVGQQLECCKASIESRTSALLHLLRGQEVRHAAAIGHEARHSRSWAFIHLLRVPVSMTCRAARDD